MCFFFTESSFDFRFLIVLNDRIKSHLTVLESAQYRDKRFATKFCFALDTRSFRWMEQCKSSKDRESVNDQLLKFDTLLDSVLIEQFHQTLPSTMRLVDDNNTGSGSGSCSGSGSGSGSSKEPDKKKQKKVEDAKERKVDNKKPINEWLCNENKNYQQKFAGKHLDKRPKLGKAPVCVRFHTKGFCFNDYVNKNTHISSQDFSTSMKKDYTDFVKVCRS